MTPDQSSSAAVQDAIDEKIDVFFSAFGIQESLKSTGQDADQLCLSDDVQKKEVEIDSSQLDRGFRAIKQVAVRVLISFPALHQLYLRLVQRPRPDQELKQFALSKNDVRSLFDGALTEFLECGDRIEFLVPASPQVSVVIAVYNQPGLLLQTLIFLRRSIPSIELVLVDNASDQQTKEVISRVDGARLIENQENLGFLKAANQGALESNGEYLLFLNSDCLVFPSAVRNAVDFALKTPSAGAVGARIINFNGLLQEAGSQVLSDGSCRGLGRGDDPNSDQHTFARQVDFCSGAFLLTPRRLFIGCGLFDEAYAPAYYEEVDYCARVLSRGLSVIYLPSATVLHYEFGSEEKRGDVVKLQIQNRHVFLRKQKQFLREKSRLSSRVIEENGVQGGFSVLVIDDRVPHATSGAGSPRCKAILEQLSRTGARVTFFATSMVTETLGSVYQTLPPEIRVVTPAGLSNLAGFLRKEGSSYDQIIVSRPNNMQAAYKELERLKRTARKRFNPKPFIVYDAEAIFADREILRADLFKQKYLKLLATRSRKKEFALFRKGDLIWAVSEYDAERIATHSGVHTIKLGHLLTPRRSSSSYEDRRDFLFVGFLGHDGSPNVDSLLWFSERIWPLIKNELDDNVRLVVAGKSSASSLTAIKDESIQLLGAMDSLESLYDRCRVFVAPTRFAAGVPHKVHEAAANGIPSVATDLLCRQLSWRDGEELLSAGNETEFANQCIRMYRDKALWKRVRDGGFKAVLRDCSPDRFRASIRQSMELATRNTQSN